MYCAKCGNPIKDTEKFCSKCGTPVKPASDAPGGMKIDAGKVTEAAAKAAAGGAKDFFVKGKEIWHKMRGREDGQGRKFFSGKNKAPFIVIGGILLVLVLLIACGPRLSNFFHRTFSSPEKYYQYVEKKALKELSFTAGELYNAYILESFNIYDGSVSAEMTVNLSKDGQELLGLAALAGVDLSWFQSMAVTAEVNVKNSVIGMNASVNVNKDDIVSGNLVMDMEDESLYLQIPELTKTYLGMEMDDYLTGYDRKQFEEFREQQASSKELEAAFPEQSEFEKLVNKYAMIALSNVDDVSIGKKTLKVEGIQQKYTEIKVKIAAKDLRDILKEILKEMEDDRELKQIITDAAAAMGLDEDDAYEEFQDEIDDTLDDIQYIDDDVSLVMKVYVDGKGEIRGRSIEYQDYYDTISVSVLMPKKGGKAGYELSVEEDGVTLELSGSGKESGNRMSGDFQLKYNGTALVDIRVKKLDTDKLKKGQLEGEFEVEISSGIRTFMGYASGMSAVKDMKFTLNTEASDKSDKAELGLSYDGKDLGTIIVSVKRGNGSKAKVPGSRDVIMVKEQDDLFDWLGTINWGKVISALNNTDLPSSVVDVIEDLGEVLEDRNLGSLWKLYRYLY